MTKMHLITSNMLCQTYQLLLLKSGLSYLPCSNDGDAMGDSSMLKNMIPSFGRLSFGATSSHDTWAMTLQNASLHIATSMYAGLF